MDSLYKAYLTALLAFAGLFFLSGLAGSDRLGADGLDSVRAHGPAALGVALAVALVAGLRSGSRGGPLAPEAADVRFLLLAPIPRTVVVRSLALRQLRGVVATPAIVGAVAGSAVAERLGGDRVEWIGAVSCFAAVVALAVWASALIASGLRVRTPHVWIAAGVLVGWPTVDLVARIETSPMTALGHIALAPLEWSWLAVAGGVAALVVVATGVAVAGGVSLERVERRVHLVNELRYAATLQDVRSVIVLHRELAQELPRARPWWNRPIPGGGACWQRGWRGIARWPFGRVVRVVVLAVLVAAAAAGVWQGTDALIIVGAGAAFLVGVDVLESLAQELDHAARARLLPVAWGRLAIRHLGVGVGVVTALALIGAAVDTLLLGSGALAVALVVAIPCAVAVIAGAALSLVLGSPSPTLLLEFGLPEFTVVLLVLRIALGPAIAASALVPIVLARTTSGSAHEAALQAAAIPALVSACALSWIQARTVPS